MLDQRLIDYITDSRKVNYGDKQIRESLLAAGWDTDKINESFLYIDGNENSNKIKNPIIPFGVIILILIIMIILVFFVVKTVNHNMIEKPLKETNEKENMGMKNTNESELLLINDINKSNMNKSLNTLDYKNDTTNNTILSCNDSDGGKNYTVSGNLTIKENNNGKIYFSNLFDLCNGSILNEYYCQGNKALSELHNCTHGCDKGSCSLCPVYEYPPNFCQNGSLIIEGVDNNGCSLPYTCNFLKKSCTDNDNGLNYTVKGTAQLVDSNGRNFTSTDYCISSYDLIEYGCNGSVLFSKNINCPSIISNGICENSICKPSCISVETCASKGKKCGILLNDCEESVSCGNCEVGYLCNRGQCVEDLGEKIVKVMVINFNPLLKSKDNVVLTQFYNWNNPDSLLYGYIKDMNEASGAFIKYEIVKNFSVDDFPIKADGFDYTESTYLDCLSDPTHNICHNPDSVDYNKILLDFNVCDMVNSGEITEVWLFGGPWFGYWEANMAGTGAWWTNGPVVTETTCNKPVHIMGFNYERGVAEMLEDFGHRTEGTLSNILEDGM
ncbi:MAG: hypothetical protein V1859_03235 [archaeon]